MDSPHSDGEIIESIRLNFSSLFCIVAVIIASYECFRLDSLEENSIDDRIVGGETTKLGQFPYIASLRIRELVNNSDVYRHRCGDSILNHRWILSAAHCTQHEYSNISNMAIAVGALHIKNDGRIYHLVRIFGHPAFSPISLRNDSSLLRTNERIHFDDLVKAVPLRKQFVDAGAASVVSG